MTNFKKLIIAAAAITSVMGATNVSAGEPGFQTSFSYDKSATAEQQYSSFLNAAKSTCETELRKAGYRATESKSWERRKCVRELVQQAVKATQNKTLIAYHNSNGAKIATRQYANK